MDAKHFPDALPRFGANRNLGLDDHFLPDSFWARSSLELNPVELNSTFNGSMHANISNLGSHGTEDADFELGPPLDFTRLFTYGPAGATPAPFVFKPEATPTAAAAQPAHSGESQPRKPRGMCCSSAAVTLDAAAPPRLTRAAARKLDFPAATIGAAAAADTPPTSGTTKKRLREAPTVPAAAVPAVSTGLAATAALETVLLAGHEPIPSERVAAHERFVLVEMRRDARKVQAAITTHAANLSTPQQREDLAKEGIYPTLEFGSRRMIFRCIAGYLWRKTRRGKPILIPCASQFASDNPALPFAPGANHVYTFTPEEVLERLSTSQPGVPALFECVANGHVRIFWDGVCVYSTNKKTGSKVQSSVRPLGTIEVTGPKGEMTRVVYTKKGATVTHFDAEGDVMA